MFRTTILAMLAFMQISMGSAWATCAGADPAITSVVVKSITPEGWPNAVNRYNLVGTVVNLGRGSQASNVLQFVDIYENGNKLDSRGIPPLKAGQSYKFSYASLRSRDAGKGTAILNFRLDMRQPSPPGQEDCNASNDSSTLRF